jgi:hypothetical protein
MKVWGRMNHIGWVHLWRERRAFEEGEASAHFFNGRTDPRWLASDLDPAVLDRMRAGELMEFEDPGYFSSDEAEGEAGA